MASLSVYCCIIQIDHQNISMTSLIQEGPVWFLEWQIRFHRLRCTWDCSKNAERSCSTWHGDLQIAAMNHTEYKTKDGILNTHKTSSSWCVPGNQQRLLVWCPSTPESQGNRFQDEWPEAQHVLFKVIVSGHQCSAWSRLCYLRRLLVAISAQHGTDMYSSDTKQAFLYSKMLAELEEGAFVQLSEWPGWLEPIPESRVPTEECNLWH
jgi:hypothetical protein